MYHIFSCHKYINRIILLNTSKLQDKYTLKKTLVNQSHTKH